MQVFPKVSKVFSVLLFVFDVCLHKLFHNHFRVVIVVCGVVVHDLLYVISVVIVLTVIKLYADV